VSRFKCCWFYDGFGPSPAPRRGVAAVRNRTGANLINRREQREQRVAGSTRSDDPRSVVARVQHPETGCRKPAALPANHRG